MIAVIHGNDRSARYLKERHAIFDHVCREHGIQHRLTAPALTAFQAGHLKPGPNTYSLDLRKTDTATRKLWIFG